MRSVVTKSPIGEMDEAPAPDASALFFGNPFSPAISPLGYHKRMANSKEIGALAPSRKRVYALFALVTIGAALGNLSQTGLNAMLPAAMADLGVSVDVGQWLTTGYMLALGVAVPLATFLMRRLDDRGYLLFSFGLFAAGSLVDWVAPEFVIALIGRVLQAVSVGLLIPKMQTTAMTQFAPGKQATAMGVAGIALGFAPNIGPTVGGFMDSAFGWRSFFVLLFALSALLIVLTFPVVRRGSASDAAARFETVSFLFSTLGFGGVLLGLSNASTYGFASPLTWVPAAIGVVFLVLFVMRQRTVEEPLINLAIFRSSVYNAGLFASIFLFACYMGVTLVIPLYVQNVLGGTSLDTGLIILPTTFTALLVNPLSGVLADKASPRLASLVFGAFLLVGSIACVFIGDETPYWLLSVYQTTRAIGVSGLIGPLLTYSLADLNGPLVPHGSTASTVIRQVAATFGTAIMVLCVTTASAFVGAESVLPYQVAFGFSALMAVLSFAFIVVRVK